MPGLIRQCRAGESFQVGLATVRVVKTGRKATINIIAPPEVHIEHQAVKHEASRRAGIEGRTKSE